MKRVSASKLKLTGLLLFLFVSLAFWILLLFFEVENVHVFYYLSIVFCFLYSLTLFRFDRDAFLQCAAFLFTCIADFFLILLLGKYKTAAMIFFLVVQIFYAIKTIIKGKNKAEQRINIISRVFLSALGASLVYIVLGSEAEFLFVISVVYYVNLILSIVFSFFHFGESISNKIFTVGLVLFALCDLSIGFEFLVNIFSLREGNIIYEIVNSPIPLSHVFYLPSQVILAASLYPRSNK